MKKTWINYMIAHNRVGLNSEIFNSLLDPLPIRQLRILKKNDDLVERTTEICKMTKMGLLIELRDKYGFEITNCQNGDVWIDGDASNDGLTPDWIEQGQLPFAGWYMKFNGEDNEFEPWARNMLFQEVRTNMWIRYMEHKIAEASKKTQNPFEQQQSLPWNGSGGNYL